MVLSNETFYTLQRYQYLFYTHRKKSEKIELSNNIFCSGVLSTVVKDIFYYVNDTVHCMYSAVYDFHSTPSTNIHCLNFCQFLFKQCVDCRVGINLSDPLYIFSTIQLYANPLCNPEKSCDKKVCPDPDSDKFCGIIIRS